MADQIEQGIEQVEQTSPEIVETAQEQVVEQPLEQDTPITSLDEAKKYMEKAKKPKNSAPTGIPTTESNTVDYAKQYKEIQSLVGKQSKELGELRKFYSENQTVINSYKQFLAQQEEQDMLAKYQQDPTAVIKELARREASAQVAPYQEQISQAQASNINSNIQSQLGPDYETYAPVMADMLDQFLQMDAQQGSNYAQELAQNPTILMQLAAGRLALEQRSQNAQQQQMAQKQKAQNLKIAQGVGRGNSVTSSPTEGLKDMSLDDMRAQMKKMGMIQ